MNSRFFKMAIQVAISDSQTEQNDFSNSESLCRSDASHQSRLKNFKMAAVMAILDIRTE